MGASIAYHLALAGAPDVVLCDRGDIAGGSTSRAITLPAPMKQSFAMVTWSAIEVLTPTKLCVPMRQ